MGKYIHKCTEYNWKLVGMIAGWIMISFNIGETSLFYSQRSQSDFYFYGTILLFGEYEDIL